MVERPFIPDIRLDLHQLPDLPTAPSARDQVTTGAKKRKAAAVEAKPKESGCFLCMVLVLYNLATMLQTSTSPRRPDNELKLTSRFFFSFLNIKKVIIEYPIRLGSSTTLLLKLVK